MGIFRVSFFFCMLLWSLHLSSPVYGDPLTVITEAQKSLKKLKYYKLEPDGISGRETRKAVMQYQYETGLPITGILDNPTIKHLKRPVLILNTQNFAPFHFKTTRPGEADGPLTQIVQLTCAEAGINCRIFMCEDWRLAQEEVKKGAADGLFVIAWNSGRAKWLHRSTAMVETEYGLFARQDDDLEIEAVMRHPALMDGYTIGVYGPSGTSNSLTKLKALMESRGVDIIVDITVDDRPLFQKLSMSIKKYAVYSNRIVGASIIKGSGLDNIRYAGRHRGLAYYVGFSQQRVPLAMVKKFNKAYMDLVRQGDVISIMANHNMPIPRGHQKAADAHDAEAVKIVAGPSKKRFARQSARGVQVVKDAATCLMWQQSGSSRYMNWSDAVQYVAQLNREHHAGFSDWRLPEIDELMGLMENLPRKKTLMHIHPIFDALQQACWSNEKNGSDIKFVDFFEGLTDTKYQGDTNFARAVRTAKCP